jgi:hypothetical protein
MNDYLLYLSGVISESAYHNKVAEKDEEKAEEKSGIDIDHDKEKGESLAHKTKVLKKHAENIAFFNKRRHGAAKIAAAAEAKGGPSILTYWHFAAKDKQYVDVLKAIKTGKDEKFFMSKYDELMDTLHKTKFNQKSFQQIVGQLEVWGEAIAQLF